MFTRKFWKDAAERAVATAAQAAGAVLVVGEGFNAFEIDWKAVGGVAIGGAVASLVKALAARFFNNSESASLVDIELTDDPGKHAEDGDW